MEAKKKAEELIMVFIGVDAKNTNEYGMEYQMAVQCALISVDEILDLGYVPNEKSSYNVYNFYSKVKIELLKI